MASSNQINFDARGGILNDVRGDQFNQFNQILHNPGTELRLFWYLYAQLYMVISYLGSKRPTSSCRRCLQP
jgi:hypothetical protein